MLHTGIFVLKTKNSIPAPGYADSLDADPSCRQTLSLEADPLPQMKTPSPPVNRMTDISQNITLPQTSFAGGNYLRQDLPSCVGLALR